MKCVWELACKILYWTLLAFLIFTVASAFSAPAPEDEDYTVEVPAKILTVARNIIDEQHAAIEKLTLELAREQKILDNLEMCVYATTARHIPATTCFNSEQPI